MLRISSSHSVTPNDHKVFQFSEIFIYHRIHPLRVHSSAIFQQIYLCVTIPRKEGFFLFYHFLEVWSTYQAAPLRHTSPWHLVCSELCLCLHVQLSNTFLFLPNSPPHPLAITPQSPRQTPMHFSSTNLSIQNSLHKCSHTVLLSLANDLCLWA